MTAILRHTRGCLLWTFQHYANQWNGITSPMHVLTWVRFTAPVSNGPQYSTAMMFNHLMALADVTCEGWLELPERNLRTPGIPTFVRLTFHTAITTIITLAAFQIAIDALLPSREDRWNTFLDTLNGPRLTRCWGPSFILRTLHSTKVEFLTDCPQFRTIRNATTGFGSREASPQHAICS